MRRKTKLILVVLAAGLSLVAFFLLRQSPTPRTDETGSIPIETVVEIASSDPTQRHCVQLKFLSEISHEEFSGGNSKCKALLAYPSGSTLVAHLMGYESCPKKDEALLGKLSRLYSKDPDDAQWLFQQQSPETCSVTEEDRLFEVKKRLSRQIHLGMNERIVEDLIKPDEVLGDGLYYLHPGIILDVEMRDQKVFELPRFYRIVPRACESFSCTLLSATAIQSRRSEFILVTKVEENKKISYEVKLCKDRRSVCEPFGMKHKWTLEAFQNAFSRYKKSQHSEPGLVFILQRAFVDGQPVWENNQLSLTDIKILLEHFDRTAFED